MTTKPTDTALIAYEQELREAQTALALAEAGKLEAEADFARIEADSARITAERFRRECAYDDASDEKHHVYKFQGVVSERSTLLCIGTLSRWSRLDPGCDITIIFNSPGGSVIDGMALWDFLTELKETHHLTTVCRGWAASMGGILLQAGHVRKMGRESFVLVHELSAGTGGKIGEMEDDMAFYKKMCDRVVNLFVSRSNGKLTAATIKRNWTRKDWYLDSVEALKYGLVDEVIGEAFTGEAADAA